MRKNSFTAFQETKKIQFMETGERIFLLYLRHKNNLT